PMRIFTVNFFSAFVVIMTIAQMTLAADVQTREFDVTTELKSLNVDNAAGKVEIKSLETDKIKVHAEKIGFGRGCELNIDASKKEVSAISKSVGAFNTNQCLVHFQIFVPAGMAIKVRTGSGDIVVNGNTGGLKVRAGSGDVKLDGQFNYVDALTGSGDLNLKA